MNGPRKRLQTLTLLAIPLILVLAARGFAQDKPEDPAETPATPPAATGGNQVPPAKDDSADPAFDPPFAGGLGSGFGPGGVFGFGTPRLVQGGDIMISWSKNNDELRGFSQKTGEWTYLKIEKQATIAPTVASDVAAARVGDAMAAYSGATGTWDVLQLSKGSKAVASVSSTSIKVVDNDHLYIFAAANGKWTSPDDPNFRRPTRSDPLVPPSAVPRRASEMQNIPFDQQALKLARELRGKGLHDAQARTQLSKAVADAFDRRQSSQKAEAARMQEKLTKIQAAITRRDSLRERIITRRVDELLDPDINWDTQPPATPAGSSTRQPSVGGPSTGTPIALPGPPRDPFAAPGILRVNTQNAGTVRTTWRQPSEFFKALRDQRSSVDIVVKTIKERQTDLKKYQLPLSDLQQLSGLEEWTEDLRQTRIRATVGRIKDSQKQLVEYVTLWKQEWSLYESQLELLRLDVQEAKVKLDSAAAKLSQVEKLAERSAVSQAEKREAATELELAKIGMRRAEQTLARYLVIQKELTRLDPAEFEIGSLLEKPENETEKEAKSP